MVGVGFPGDHGLFAAELSGRPAQDACTAPDGASRRALPNRPAANTATERHTSARATAAGRWGLAQRSAGRWARRLPMPTVSTYW